MLRTAAVILVVALLLAAPVAAGEFNKKLNVGDPAPAFKDLEGVDGKKLSLDDFKSRDVVVLVITCNHCPVSASYENRLIAFTKKYAGADGKVAVVAISVGLDEDDQLPKMKERAAAKGFNFPYLHDPSQQIGRALGAGHTPEFFVLNKDRKIVYMGAMDDNLDAKQVKANYLEAAITALLKGEKPAPAETRPFGCGIEYRKK